MIGEDLFSDLTGSTLITTLTSSRVYPQMIPPETAFPCLRYFMVADIPQETLNGVDALTNPTYQVDAYSTSYSQSQTLAKNIRTVLDASTTLGMVVQTRADSFFDDWDTDKRIFGVSSDFSVWGRD